MVLTLVAFFINSWETMALTSLSLPRGMSVAVQNLSKVLNIFVDTRKQSRNAPGAPHVVNGNFLTLRKHY